MAQYLKELQDKIGADVIPYAKLTSGVGMTNAPIKVQSFLAGKIHQIHRNELMGSLRGRKKALFMTQAGSRGWIVD